MIQLDWILVKLNVIHACSIWFHLSCINTDPTELEPQRDQFKCQFCSLGKLASPSCHSVMLMTLFIF